MSNGNSLKRGILSRPTTKYSLLITAFILVFFMASVTTVYASVAIPVTYLNVNFGPNNSSGDNFYRSSGTITQTSATADVRTQKTAQGAQFSASANNDPNEVSSAFSSYNIGTVNNGPASFQGVSVSPSFLKLSGSASFAMNLWFDSDHDGEYFMWSHNEFAGLGGDVYAIGPSGTGTLTITSTTPLFLIPDCNPGVFVATLAVINAGGCSTIPAGTNVAMWVGINIPANTVGSGSATV
jgi:hypothetical protein